MPVLHDHAGVDKLIIGLRSSDAIFDDDDDVNHGLRMDGSNSLQWYKIICTDKEVKQRRVEELRKEKQDQEMAECTFRPELLTRGSKKVLV